MDDESVPFSEDSNCFLDDDIGITLDLDEENVILLDFAEERGKPAIGVVIELGWLIIFPEAADFDSLLLFWRAGVEDGVD